MKQNIFFIILIGLCMGVLYYFIERTHNQKTVIEGKTITITLPGRTDTIPKYIPVKVIKVDSSEKTFWKNKYDSVQNIIARGDSTRSADSAFANYFLPSQAIVKDSLTENFLTLFPLNPIGTRVRLDSTRYDTLKFNFTYIDTTINVMRKNTLRTYAVVGGGAALGAAVANVPGAGIGGIVALIIDELF